jgi:hypothetical protein
MITQISLVSRWFLSIGICIFQCNQCNLVVKIVLD